MHCRLTSALLGTLRAYSHPMRIANSLIMKSTSRRGDGGFAGVGGVLVRQGLVSACGTQCEAVGEAGLWAAMVPKARIQMPPSSCKLTAKVCGSSIAKYRAPS